MDFTITQITPLLLVGNLEEAIAFYTKQLGFVLVFRYEDFYAGIEKNGHAIHLKTNYDTTGKAAERASDENIDLLFTVENIALLFADISANGIEIVQPLREMPYGTEFYIADPDGHAIAFMGGNYTGPDHT